MWELPLLEFLVQVLFWESPFYVRTAFCARETDCPRGRLITHGSNNFSKPLMVVFFLSALTCWARTPEVVSVDLCAPPAGLAGVGAAGIVIALAVLPGVALVADAPGERDGKV